MSAELDQVTFRRVEPAPPGTPDNVQLWDMVAPDGGFVFARAEVFSGDSQWGVRLADRAPAISDTDLVKLVGRLLIWGVGCRADTVDVVLSRTHEHHALVRVGADYV